MNDYIIYTDGSYRSSKDAMGIGLVWLKNGIKVLEYSKRISGGTNNIAELYAIKVALSSIKDRIKSLTIITDSEYSIGCITNPSWRPKKNTTLINSIKKLLKETQKLVEEPIVFTHVKGHNGDLYNEQVDSLAQNASNSIPDD